MKSLPDMIGSVQGVRQLAPREVRASAPGGFDWINNSVVVGFGSNTSKLGILKSGIPKELQAASPRPQATKATRRINVRVPQLGLVEYALRCASRCRPSAVYKEIWAGKGERRLRPSVRQATGYSHPHQPRRGQRCGPGLVTKVDQGARHGLPSISVRRVATSVPDISADLHSADDMPCSNHGELNYTISPGRPLIAAIIRGRTLNLFLVSATQAQTNRRLPRKTGLRVR